MKKAGAAMLLFLLLGAAFPGLAWAQELELGGQIVGIQIRTEGVLVADMAPVETAEGSRSPAEEAGIHRGDLILAVCGRAVNGTGELVEAVAELAGEPAELTVLRKEERLQLFVRPALSTENQWKLGMWLRDGISGIGTLTFRDPVTGRFGALGHSISDADTGVVVPLNSGYITDAQIVGVTPGAAGAPGELNGCADLGQVLGSVEHNTGHGVYGRMDTAPGGATAETGEIRLGQASILCTVNGRETREYAVQITRIYKDSDGEHVLLNVTDPSLLSATGGIVQGMSGSPILQNGFLVGAVTHVFVNDPTKGYGISIYDMLDDADLMEKAA